MEEYYKDKYSINKTYVLVKSSQYFPWHYSCSIDRSISYYTLLCVVNGTHFNASFSPLNTSFQTIAQNHQAYFLFFPSVGQRQTDCWIDHSMSWDWFQVLTKGRSLSFSLCYLLSAGCTASAHFPVGLGCQGCWGIIIPSGKLSFLSPMCWAGLGLSIRPSQDGSLLPREI